MLVRSGPIVKAGLPLAKTAAAGRQ